MDILRHVGVFPFLPLLVPPHHYQQGGEGEWQCEHRNFHLSFNRVKNFPLGLERPLYLTKCCQQCFLDEDCGDNVEDTSEQRLAANNLR